MSNSELQALLANLRPRSQASQAATSQLSARDRDTSHSFLSASQIPSTPPPPFSPAPSTGVAPSNNALAQNLLSLLNFNQTSSSPAALVSSAPSSQNTHQDRASFSRSPQTSRDISNLVARSSSEREVSGQDLGSPTQLSVPMTESGQLEPSSMDEQQNSENLTSMQTSGFADQQSSQNTARVAQNDAQSIFTYKNPFEALRASRPLTPRSSNPATVTTPSQPTQEQQPMQSIEDSEMQEELNKAMPDRIKLTPKSRTSRQSTPAQTNAPPQEMVEQVSPIMNGDSSYNGAREIATDVHDHVAEGPVAPTESGKQEQEEKAGGTNDSGGPPTSGQVEGRVVKVMNFPVKAFVSITLQLKEPTSTRVREDGVMEIARLKREFDQIDRSLAAASSKYITYALVNKGGMRIIRQDDGKDRHIFKHTHDRVFNASICTTSMTAAPGPHQAVLGTGVSGAVYYATISHSSQDFFDTNSLDSESLIFPAYPQADEHTAGGVLKTRAKRSSKHPEFFAIGRGKSIHIVWPSVVMSPRYGVTEAERKVNTEKFFQDRPLQILTGKAGKDFSFSEDDTVIVSLDKTGRLRFWDIRKLIDEDNARAVQVTPYIIESPMLSLSTASPAERSWPTSALFVDKARPYIKGGPLRYVLVGLRQNHTLQLWDIALGKAVQELNFPHESESDGICSVAYHSASGIIVVGHPTRNSLFFIHLSAPRYVLSSSLTQASYIQRVAAKDPEIPKPESTACMSGYREISFEGRGQMRSVELLPVYKPTDTSAPTTEDDGLFELYVAHSTGVTCLVINKKDLGWDNDNKSIHSVNAEQEGLVTIKKLELGSVIEENARGKSPLQEQPAAAKASKKKNKKNKDGTEESVNGTQDTQVSTGPAEPTTQATTQPDAAPVEQTAQKESKKSKKKKEALAQAEAAAAAVPKEPLKSASPEKEDIQQPASTAPSTSRYNLRSQSQPEQVSMGISGDWLDKEIKKIEKGVALEFKRELVHLYDNMKTDRASQDQAAASRQEAVLRVVSTTLSNNVEKTLSDIISTQIQSALLPQLVQTVSAEVSNKVLQSISQVVPQELSAILPGEITKTLQDQQLLQRVSDNISQPLILQISQSIEQSINASATTAMQRVAAATASEVVSHTESRLMEQVAQLQRQQTAQVDTLNQVSSALQSVAQTVQAMSQSQMAFQNQILQDKRAMQTQEHSRASSAQHVQQPQPVSKPQQQQAQHRPPVESYSSPVQPARPEPTRQRTLVDIEIEEVSSLMEQRKYEEGSIKWLQSSQPVKLFDDLFVRFTPDYLATDVSPLVAFSIGVTVGNSLSTNTPQRLQWISAALDAVDFRDREINELAPHAPNLVSALIQKLDNLYIQVAKSEAESALLAIISTLSIKARNVRETFLALATGRGVID